MTTSRYYCAALVLSVALLFGLSAWSSIALTAGFDRIALIWFSNGIVVAALLIHHEQRWLWRSLIGGAFTANLTLNAILGDPPIIAVGIALANLTEICIAAYALRGTITASGDLLQVRRVVRFFIVALVIAPCAGALVAAISMHIARGSPIFEVMQLWLPADALGLGIVVPLGLALRPREMLATLQGESWFRTLTPFVLLVIVAVCVFGQQRYPLLFLLLPPILFVVFRLGFNGAALAISIVATIAIEATLHGSGPFMLVPQASMAERVFPMQLLLGSLIITTYPICAMIAMQRKLLVEAADQAARMRESQATISDLNERMQLAAHAANVGFYSWRLDTNESTWDEQVFRMFQIDARNGSPTYDTWRSRIHPQDLARVDQALDQALHHGTAVDLDFRIVLPDGAESEIRTRGVVQRDLNGKPVRLAGLSIDITELRRLDRMKSEFVAIVSHELRTPLTSIRGALGLLNSGKVDASKAPSLLQLAHRNAERLAVLIDDILDIERIESGRMRFDMKAYPLSMLITDSIAANTPYAARHQVQLRLRNDAPLCHVQVDANRMLQVMANLLSNAAKFSPSGATVEVSVTEQMQGVRIAVRDRGPGISPEFQGKIFDKFSQSDSSDTREKGGSGLGLAISKALIERMEGTISFITSKTGTTFFVDLPIVNGFTDIGVQPNAKK